MFAGAVPDAESVRALVGPATLRFTQPDGSLGPPILFEDMLQHADLFVEASFQWKVFRRRFRMPPDVFRLVCSVLKPHMPIRFSLRWVVAQGAINMNLCGFFWL